MTFRVFLGDLRLNSYIDLIEQGLQYIQFEKLVSSSTRIFIKPNLTFPTYRLGVMTSPDAIKSAILAIRKYTPHIFIGDSDSGGYNRFSMDEVYREIGLQDLAQEYGVQIVNLSNIERRTIEFTYRNQNISLGLPKLLTDETDLLITMPVPKIHANTGVSLSFKNQWGCIPENKDRLRLHPYFHHVILEVNKAIKTRVVIMDGKYGLNRNGPMLGDPVELNWIMVADDPGAAARVATELMQIPLSKIKHLRYAEQKGFIPEWDLIDINQQISSFQTTKFYLKRKWTDLPGYIAFQNSFFSYLAYFSPFADILHRMLYIFRQPFYDYGRYSNSVTTTNNKGGPDSHG
jgi:uncharacterized protein (DUF362 family)